MSKRSLQGVAGATVWDTPGHLGICATDRAKATIKEIVAEMTDTFLNDYLKANPKK